MEIRIEVGGDVQARLRKGLLAARSAGLCVDEVNQRFKGHGFVGSYSASANAIVVRVEGKPWYVTRGLLERRLRNFFE
jgi:hypothetical protein